MIISKLEMDTYCEWVKQHDFPEILELDGVARYKFASNTAHFAFIRFDVSCCHLLKAMAEVPSDTLRKLID